jgi:glycosyltransferase involved in cell wall biosynthesis
MKIGIDIRCLAEGRRTGVEEYTLNFLEHLFQKDQKNAYVLFFNSFHAAKIDFSWLTKYPNVKIKRLSLPNKLLNFSLWYLNWPKLDTLVGGADIFFMPNIIFGGVSRRSKLIVTVHDLSFERYPETFSRVRRVWHAFVNPRRICQQADKIIAVSESTKNDIVGLLGIKPEKIEQIYSGVSDKFRVIDRNDEKLVKVKDRYDLPYKFILYLGTIEPRKNIIAIVRAYAQLMRVALADEKLEELGKYKLVLAGSKGWLSQDIFAEIEKVRRFDRGILRDNIIVLNFVEDADKEYIYNLATLFVYPSFFEGFGFPVLEAMKCGVPVITSNNSSLPELVGDAAIMIDPDKPQEIFLAMREILSGTQLRQKMIGAGIAQASKFSWERAVTDFLEMVEKMS